MPRITVNGGDKLRREHPREYALLYQLGGSADGIDSQVCSCGADGRAPLPCLLHSGAPNQLCMLADPAGWCQDIW